MTKKEYAKRLKKLKEINSRNTKSLNKKQPNQLAEYAIDMLTGTQPMASYRYLIYDILKPEVGYADGMYLGLLDFNNLLCDLYGRAK
jgi:type IV secretory pathway VirB4 component